MCEKPRPGSYLKSARRIYPNGVPGVDVDLAHTCPVCGRGPLPRRDTFDQDRMSKDLSRFCCAECWPQLEARGYA